MSHLFLRNSDDVLQLTELRRIIEVESVRLAAERATPLDISHIRDAAQRYDTSLQTNEDTSDADWELHMAFCLASHNTFVAEVMRMFYQLFNEYGPIRRDLVKRDAEFSWSRRHFEILQAVVDHKGVEAARLMDAYLLDVSRAIREWFAEAQPLDGRSAIGQSGATHE
jgi:DNA-binding FadR family transcriptional regulator